MRSINETHPGFYPGYRLSYLVSDIDQFRAAVSFHRDDLHGPSLLPATNEVEMDMKNELTTTLFHVEKEFVAAFRSTELFG